MEILNIGPLELIIILVLMFILLGPKEMVLTAHRIGEWVRSFLRSPMWREIWGISQDIRELPKKIVSETGLDETLAEVRQTTQEATNEINRELKEAADAARVPEAEHLRIDPNAVPAAAVRPSISQAGKAFAEQAAAKLDVAASAGAESADQEVQAVEEVAPEASPKRRGRPRKVVPAVETEQIVPAEPIVPEAEAAGEPQAVEAPRRRGRPRKSPVVPETVEAAPVVAELVVEPAEAPKPVSRMRAVPVLTGAPMAKPQPPVVTAQPEVVQPLAELPAAELPVDSIADAEADAFVNAAASAGEDAPKRRGRPRKTPAVVQVVEPDAEIATAHDNGSSASLVSAEAAVEELAKSEEAPAAARKPRKPRATKRPENGSVAAAQQDAAAQDDAV